jgi:hypothetical protein
VRVALLGVDLPKAVVGSKSINPVLTENGHRVQTKNGAADFVSEPDGDVTAGAGTKELAALGVAEIGALAATSDGADQWPRGQPAAVQDVVDVCDVRNA